MIKVDRIYVLTTNEVIPSRVKEWREKLKSIPIHAPLELVACPHHATLQHSLSSHEYEEESLSVEDIQLATGHWNIWTSAFKDGLQCIMILEDPVVLSADHYHVLDTPEPWDIIYLGRESYSGDSPIGNGLVIPGYSHGSYAYLLTRSGMEKLLRSGFQRSIIPVQEFFSVMHGTHPKGISAMYEGILDILAPMKNLIESASDDHHEDVHPEEQLQYIPLHPELFEVADDNWATNYINPQIAHREFDLICDEPIANVYSFPLFASKFCREIIAEAEHFGKWTNYRYKDHPSIDIMLNSLGLDEIYSNVLRQYVYPLFRHKYQMHEGVCDGLKSQSFVVRYLAEEQRHLGLHNDACDISMIVTLNTEFDGGGTFFPKFGKLIRHEQPGYASIHPGFVGYVHGARPITRGRRYILASFFFRE